MVLASRSLIGRKDAPIVFALNRIFRIVPLYWLVNLIKLAALMAFPSAVLGSPDFLNIICSFLFLPSYNSTGLLEPLYGVGWTLNFEMFFYFVFSVALFLKFRPVVFAGVVILVVAILSPFVSESFGVFGFYFKLIVLNFLYGMVLAIFLEKVRKIPVWKGFGLFVLGGVLVLFPPPIELLCVQYGILVLGVVVIEPMLSRLPQWVLSGGDASYSLYLLHPMVGPAVVAVCVKFGILSPVFIFFTIISLSVFVSVVCFNYFERPVGAWLKLRFL